MEYQLVTSEQQIIDNLYRFDNYRNLYESREWFLDRLRLGRNFVYAELNGTFIFAPSRFVGYANRSIEDHKKDESKDGGKTDPAIQEILGEAKEDRELEKKYQQFFEQVCEQVGMQKEVANYERKYWKLNQFRFRSGNNSKKSLTSKSSIPETLVELQHNNIQSALYEHLVALHGMDSVGTENPSGIGGRIDAVVRHQNTHHFTFYEIKTALTAKACIREAFGQLMEYAYWPKSSSTPTIEALIIVGEAPLETDGHAFLNLLRTKFSLPLFYQQFDMKKKQLVTSP